MSDFANNEAAGKQNTDLSHALSTTNALTPKPVTRICITVPQTQTTKNKNIDHDKTVPSTAMNARAATPQVNSTSLGPTISPTPTRKASPEDHSFSSKSLPLLPDHVIAGIHNHSLQFRTNAEPCSLQLSPTGRLLAVAFTDGTVRLFDMTGRYKPTIMPSSIRDVQPKGTHCCSYTHQRFGAVAVQLEAKGVHRSLVLQVDVSPDAQWFFAGALRGSMEMAAIYIGDLEAALSRPFSAEKKIPGNLLDLVKVYTHSDAKLRGFEACTCFPTTGASPQYLLLTGRGIKNCHVWRFVPPSAARPFPLFEAIMNLPTNGTTVKFLHFQEKPFLQAVTKSDDMKVQVWDLREAKARLINSPDQLLIAPLNRPAYQDVPLTESALGVAGSVCLCGGSEHLFNTLSVVNLDDRLSHATELALPGTSTNRRRSRGDLQSVASVATLFNDADHALLQLADDSLVWFKLSHVHPTLVPMTEPGFVEKVEKRKVQIRRVGYQGTTIAISATFDSNRGAGKIQFKILEETKAHGERFWGYLGDSLNLTPEQTPAPVQERENIDTKSFGSMEDEDDGSSGSDSLKIVPKAPAITPSLSKLVKQSIVTPQVSDVKHESALERTGGSALKPLARQLTQTLPFVCTKKLKKSPTSAEARPETTKKSHEKRAHLNDDANIPRKKKAKVETTVLEDLAAASILKSIGQVRHDNSEMLAPRLAVPTENRVLKRTEVDVSVASVKDRANNDLGIPSSKAHRIKIGTVKNVEKEKEAGSVVKSSMSPPVPRKKSSSSPFGTTSAKTTAQQKSIGDENRIPIENARTQCLPSKSKPEPATELTSGNPTRVSDSRVPHLAATKVQGEEESKQSRARRMPTSQTLEHQKLSESSTDSSLPIRGAAKVQAAAPTEPEPKVVCTKVKKNSISKRCSKYIEKLQIELNKLGPHKSRLLTMDTSTGGRMRDEQEALKMYAMKRALRMTIAVLKSVQLQPTRLAWLEAKTFLDECLKDLNVSWRENLFCLQLDESASLEHIPNTEVFAMDLSLDSFCREKLGLSDAA